MELKELLNRYEVSQSLTSAILGTSAEFSRIKKSLEK